MEPIFRAAVEMQTERTDLWTGTGEGEGGVNGKIGQKHRH